MPCDDLAVTTQLPPDRGSDAQAPPPRRGIPVRVWLLAGFIAALVLITATGGIRGWWAHRLHDITGGSKGADFVIGLVVGLLPVIAVGLGALRSRGRGRLHRAWRMFAYGAVGFVITYLLSPSLSKVITDSSSRHVFEQQAPSYLPGVFTGTAIWLLLLVVAVLRARSRRRTRRSQPPANPSRRVIDV